MNSHEQRVSLSLLQGVKARLSLHTDMLNTRRETPFCFLL